MLDLFRVVLFLTMLTASAANAETQSGPYDAAVLRVKDGDTFEARVIVWPNIEIVASIRIRGIDTPEYFKSRCEAEKSAARAAKTSLRRIIDRQGPRYLDGELPIVVLRNIEYDGFGRVLADVSKENQRVATILKNQGHDVQDLEDGRSPLCVSDPMLSF